MMSASFVNSAKIAMDITVWTGAIAGLVFLLMCTLEEML